MSYYCANYYSYINCDHIVSRFGERCDLCLALKTGASLSNGILPKETSHNGTSVVEEPRKSHRRGRDGSSRALRVDSRYGK